MRDRNFKHEDDTVIDRDTGEVMYWYIRIPYIYPVYSKIERHYTLARDESELYELVQQYGEKRYGEVSYHLNKQGLGKWYTTILKLCVGINYYNVGFYSRDSLCTLFNVSPTNLNRTLNKFTAMNLFYYCCDNLTNKSTIKIVWNPLSVWKGWKGKTRIVAIQEWYKVTGCTFDVDDLLDTKQSRQIDVSDLWCSFSPDPYVSPYYSGDKSNYENLMRLSDVEFELLLLELDQPNKRKSLNYI